MKGLLLVALLAFVVSGCATHHHRPPPLSQADVIEMTKTGATDDVIIRQIKETRTVFRLSSNDIVHLRQEGVSPRVVDFMIDTYVRYSVYEQRRADYDYGWHYRFGFWYGPHW